MKILLISTNFSPELTGIGKYSGEMTDWLAKHGHSVHVICAPPYYPEWKIDDNYSRWRYQISDTDNPKVYRCPLWVPTKPSALKRLIHLFSFSLFSMPMVLKQFFWQPDWVICIEPPLFNSMGALLVAKLCGAKSLLHIQDFEVDAAFGANILKSKRLKKVCYAIEHLLMQRFSCISTISEAMLEKLNTKNISADKRFLFPNWVDISLIYPLKNPSIYRQELSIPNDKIVALYSGNMGEKQGLNIIIDSAHQLINANVIFVLCGSGSALSTLKKSAKQLKNIIWLPLQPLNKLNELLNLADIHLLPQQANIANLVMPSKLTGMLSSGKAIIATAESNTQVAKIVENCGIIVKPNDSLAFSNAIKNLSLKPELRESLGIKARQYAEEKLQYDSILQNFENNLKKLAKKL